MCSFVAVACHFYRFVCGLFAILPDWVVRCGAVHPLLVIGLSSPFISCRLSSLLAACQELWLSIANGPLQPPLFSPLRQLQQFDLFVSHLSLTLSLLLSRHNWLKHMPRPHGPHAAICPSNWVKWRTELFYLLLSQYCSCCCCCCWVVGIVVIVIVHS